MQKANIYINLRCHRPWFHQEFEVYFFMHSSWSLWGSELGGDGAGGWCCSILTHRPFQGWNNQPAAAHVCPRAQAGVEALVWLQCRSCGFPQVLTPVTLSTRESLSWGGAGAMWKQHRCFTGRGSSQDTRLHLVCVVPDVLSKAQEQLWGTTACY